MPERKRSATSGVPPSDGMVWIRGGEFLMGSDRHYPEEAPAHRVAVNGFWMDTRAVTNREFRRFVDATGHVTLAEKPANAADYPGAKPEMLVPSSVMFKKSDQPVDLRNHYNWWATRPAPTGVIRAAREHRCKAFGTIRWFTSHSTMRRPMRNGRASSCRPKPSGSSRRAAASTVPNTSGATSSRPDGKPMCNHWQGEFPWQNLLDRRLRVDRAGRIVPAERLRPARDGRQRLGVDHRLVPGARPHRARLLHARQPARRRARRQLRSAHARRAHPAQGDEGRLVPVRAELLPSLPAGRTHGASRSTRRPVTSAFAASRGRVTVLRLKREAKGLLDG